MTIRDTTLARQIGFERATIAKLINCFGRHRLDAVDDLLVIHGAPKPVYLCLHISRAPLPQERRSRNSRLKRQGFRVRVCRTIKDVELVIATVR